MTQFATAGPPRTPLAVRVGVTGHRPDRLAGMDENLLRHKVRETLLQIQEIAREIAGDPHSGYFPGDPILRVISSVAEGADQMVAEEGLKLGFELQCPLPFPREQYEQDYATPESRQQFRALLQGKVVLELDGSRESEQSRNHAYEAAGRTVLRQCDVLIAIWDGQPAKGQGGTGQIVGEALKVRIPAVRINPQGSCSTSLLIAGPSGEAAEKPLDSLRAQLRSLLVFEPAHDEKGTATDFRDIYFAERQGRFAIGMVFEIFLRVAAFVPLKWPGFFSRDFEPKTRAEWKEVWTASPDVPPAAKKQVEQGFLVHYAWADKLASHYANAYRSSFVINYLLAACAVVFALPGFFSEKHQVIWTGLELASIVFIIVLTALGRKRLWHQRWIDYRLLAEKLRQMRFLFLIGRSSRADRVPEYESHGDPRKTWVNWHFQAVTRHAGMVNESFVLSYRQAYDKLLTGHELPSQVRYHEINARKFGRAHKHLRILGTTLFMGTLIVCFLRLLPYMFAATSDKNSHATYHAILTQLAAILPAFGAALHGIVSQGDFPNIERRSTAMHLWLDGILGDGSHEDISSEALGDRAEKAAEVMGAELIEWRVGFQDKPLTYPS